MFSLDLFRSFLCFKGLNGIETDLVSSQSLQILFRKLYHLSFDKCSICARKPTFDFDVVDNHTKAKGSCACAR